jgi:hypothetical protein
MDLVQTAFVFLFLGVVAAFLGYRRGGLREIITMFALIFLGLTAFSTQFQLGDALINIINEIGRLLQEYVFQRGSVTQEALDNYYVIPPDREELALFVIYLVGVFFLYYFTSTSSRLKVKSPPSITGALFGLVNAYILGMTLFPYIPNGLPAPSIVLENRALAQRGIEAFQKMMASVGLSLAPSTLTLIVFFLIALITIQAVRELRRR